MSSRSYYLNEPDVNIERCVFLLFTLMTDGFDFGNVLLSMDEMRSKQTLNTGTYIHYLYCCNCLCLGCSGCCLLCTMCCSCCFPIIDVVSCLVVLVGDLPQALLDAYYSKDPSALHTIFNLPDAAAVLIVTLARTVLLIIRRTSTGQRSGPDEECGANCQNIQAFGLVANFALAAFSLGIFDFALNAVGLHNG